MNTTFDHNLFTQVGLDSGALTMLGAIVHSFGEPGEYRGVVRRGTEPEATFYISVVRDSPVAQANVDLSKLVQSTPGADSGNRFVVNPKGHVVFHVTGGSGGFSVLVRRAEEDAAVPVFDSRELKEGDIFSAIILRPGTYAVRNHLNKATTEVTVSYPRLGKTAYRPPSPVKAESGARAIEPGRISLGPGQGLNLHVKAPSHFKIDLVRPDDGTGHPLQPGTGGWKKSSLPAR
jgi:hypothetical protein